MLRLLALTILPLVALPVYAQLPQIEVLAWSRSAVQSGGSCELQVASGNHTQEISQLLFSLPGIHATPRVEKADLLSDQVNYTGVFDVKVDPSSPIGICEVRALGRFGISNPRGLLITQQPLAVAAGDHSDPALAVRLEPRTIASGMCQPQKRNYYSLRLTAGEQLHLAAYAQPLDSRALPTVVLYNAQRQELARSRAVGGWPAEIRHNVTQDGDYLIAIHDFLFLGGSEYGYLMECALDQAPLELDQLLGIDRRATPQNVPALKRTPLASIERFATLVETQQSSKPPPLQVRDSFQSGSVAIHDFVAQKDDALWIEVASHSLGQLTDPHLLLYRKKETAEASEATLQQVLEQDDPASLGDASMRARLRDPQISWTVPEDGEYRVELRDQEGGDRPHNSRNYLLEVGPRSPHFQLLAFPRFPSNNLATARPWGANVLRGGTTSIDILVVRKAGFSDPIEVILENLPAAVSAEPIVIPASSTQGSITIVGDADAPSGQAVVDAIGRSSNDPTSIARAWVGTVTWPATPTHNAVQCRLTSELVVSVAHSDVAPLQADLGGGETLEVQQGGKLSIPVKVTRREGGQSACLMRPQQLPPQVTLPEFTIAADSSEGMAELAVGENAALGEFSFWLQNETKIKWRENPQSLQRAEDLLQKLNEALSQATDAADKPALEAAVAKAKERVDSLKKSTAEKELTVWLPTTTQRVRIVPKPQAP